MEDDEEYEHSPNGFYYPDEDLDETSIEATSTLLRFRHLPISSQKTEQNNFVERVAFSYRYNKIVKADARMWPGIAVKRRCLRHVTSSSIQGLIFVLVSKPLAFQSSTYPLSSAEVRWGVIYIRWTKWVQAQKLRGILRLHSLFSAEPLRRREQLTFLYLVSRLLPPWPKVDQ